MRIHILFQFIDGPWGGGNQFLKSLKKYFQNMGVYVNDPEKADIILFNSHHCLEKIINIKKQQPDKILIHRVDGPILLVRGYDRAIDEMIFEVNNLLADGTVFQSNWSRTKCYEHGMSHGKYQEIIMNAPDPALFFAKREKNREGEKIKIIATSWSSNMKKGFDIYGYLDKNLDFNKYEMTFVGNSPIYFRNIRYVEPLPSDRLAEELRRNDIFVTASTDDPCSNSLIEALHCGLPAVVINSGGHPEIIGKAGTIFDEREDACKAIEIVANNYSKFIKNVNPLGIKNIGYKYYKFAQLIYADFKSKRYVPKKLSNTMFVKMFLLLKLNKMRLKIKYLSKHGMMRV